MYLELQNSKGTSVPIAHVNLTTAHVNLTIAHVNLTIAHVNLTAFLKEKTQ